jgi:hypothetical protein
VAHALLITPDNELLADGLVAHATLAAVRCDRTLRVTTFAGLFGDPDRHLVDVDAVILPARASQPTNEAEYFHPTQAPAGCAATLVRSHPTGTVVRVTAFLPTGTDAEFPVLLAAHLGHAGVDRIYNLIDLLTPQCADAMVDPSCALVGGRSASQIDLDTLKARIAALALVDAAHPGWDLHRVDLDALREFARQIPELTVAIMNAELKLRMLQTRYRAAYNALNGTLSQSLGTRTGYRVTAETTRADLRAFLGFDVMPRTTQRPARQRVDRGV